MSDSLAAVISVCVITWGAVICVGLPLLGVVLRFGVLPVLVAARRPTAAPQLDSLQARVDALEQLLDERWLRPALLEAPLPAFTTRARS